ncbi:fumarylacetoacetate hydrolase family protein [Cellulomonas wangsupingiae]|uniref:Fumarylacetoacetate hydrolase family protein n=1 Tax=Cellulomonas wangsupingiae TaxID=2968085 RepID=A0ABY5K4X6_9CELL|nr:fumarylacetoacetate hydrolase family protein [Cellulomonas wangsupingiae]MCC2335008.1 fumarylacetoacetate hydrolase family protein [Cellulomonas wangsupingiae]UUI65507.1 fumarylacetoacetate hydrolase family protein [Cellulomonas wangsupingiae]
MRLGTLRLSALGDGEPTATVAVRLDDDLAVEVPGVADVGALLAALDWRERAAAADGRRHALAGLEPRAWAPPVLRPSKIVCVGLNYRNHILEMGRDLPEHPTLFAKYPEALIGPYDPIVLPAHAADAVDWEGEVAVVVGATARRLDEAAAADAIAGYAVLNDVTMRDYQYRTAQWLQGKTFEATTPFGPWLTVTDAPPAGELRTVVDDEQVQHTPVDDMVFGPAALVAYVSQILTLHPGDVIATGTPGGVGHARKPPRYLRPGQVLTTSVTGLGELRNDVVAEA